MISRALLPAPRAAVRGGQRAAVRARPAAALRSTPRPAAWALRGSGAPALRRPLRSQSEGAAEEAPPAAEAAPAEAEAAPAEAAAPEPAPAPAAAARPADAENEMDLSEVEWTSDADWAQAAGYTRDGMVRPRLRQLGSSPLRRSCTASLRRMGLRRGPQLTHAAFVTACRTSPPRTRVCGRTKRTCSTAGPSSCSAAESWRCAPACGAPGWPGRRGADARVPPNAEIRGRSGRVFHGALLLNCAHTSLHGLTACFARFHHAGLPQIWLQPRGQRHHLPRVGAGCCRGFAHRRLQPVEPKQVRCRRGRACRRCTRS